MVLNARARFLIITLLVIVLGGVLAYLGQYAPDVFSMVFPKTRFESACQGEISKITFKIHPNFYLNKNFLSSERLSEEEARAYIEKHIRYVYLAMPAFNKEQTPKFSVIPNGGFKISKVEQRETKYPLALETSWTDVNPYFLNQMNQREDIDSLYMKKAVAAGRTFTTDVAINISYEADIELLLCESEQRHFSGEVTLPTDPFLGFWFVPESKRVRKFHEVSRKDEPITPCANDEFLYDHDPYYYWHYFALDGKTCKESILPNAVQSFHIENKTVISTETKKPFDLKFLDQVRARELKMTVNFTLIDDDSVFKKMVFDFGLIPQVQAIVDNPRFSEAKTAISQLDKYDVALQSGLIFVWSMKSISEKFQFQQLVLEDQLMQWRLSGELKQSHQKYEILVTMGSAMKEAQSYENFYKSLNQGFAGSDIVYFGGHSGVGKNLSENRIHEEVVNLYSSLGNNQIPDHQLLILMTCYAVHYFPPDGFPMPSKPFVRDILSTASVPAGYDARILVGLMEQIDLYLAKGKQLPLEKWPAYYERDVFLVHQQIRK